MGILSRIGAWMSARRAKKGFQEAPKEIKGEAISSVVKKGRKARKAPKFIN